MWRLGIWDDAIQLEALELRQLSHSVADTIESRFELSEVLILSNMSVRSICWKRRCNWIQVDEFHNGVLSSNLIKESSLVSAGTLYSSDLWQCDFYPFWPLEKDFPIEIVLKRIYLFFETLVFGDFSRYFIFTFGANERINIKKMLWWQAELGLGYVSYPSLSYFLTIV